MRVTEPQSNLVNRRSVVSPRTSCVSITAFAPENGELATAVLCRDHVLKRRDSMHGMASPSSSETFS
eukprot:6210816-Pleurochrysis_carterae.AAC.1